MQEYSDVQITSLDESSSKTSPSKTGLLKLNKDSEDKVYLLTLNDGEAFLSWGKIFFFHSIVFRLDSSILLTIKLDESIEHLRSGSNGIVLSLPKQQYSAYLFKFSNTTGRSLFDQINSISRSFSTRLDVSKFFQVLGAIKAGKTISDSSISQFDERTEESSAVQYFQVKHCSLNDPHRSRLLLSTLVLRLSLSTTKYDARLHSYIDLSTRDSR